MAYVYKKLTAQDIAIVPFNAHKQYDFNSASAASNQVTHYNSEFTQLPISTYSGNSGSDDTINTIKYNQIDHLFYRDHLKKQGNKKDFIHYLRQRKDLYKKTNILSVPTGLYGFEIKKSSFFLSSSDYSITDDSYGNLIISGTNVNEYPNDVQQNVFRLDPIKGFEKYDLSLFDDKYLEVINKGLDTDFNHRFTAKQFYRRGSNNPEASEYYSTTNINPIGKTFTSEGISESIDTPYPPRYVPLDEDDSYFFNPLVYKNVTFIESGLGSTNHKFPEIHFHSDVTSSIRIPHNERFNFHKKQDFSISFYMTPNIDKSTTNKRYIITKNGTQTIANLSSSTFSDQSSPIQHPFEIYIQSQSLYFSRSDGNSPVVINGEITSSGAVQPKTHILCQSTGSTMQIYFNGNKIAEASTNFLKSTKNKADLFIGAKGLKSDTDASTSTDKYFTGSISNINIWSKAYSPTEIANISESINASPYIGNIFYSSGFASITHPKYYDVISGSTGLGTINTLQFQGSHLIYEHEYQCTVQEYEYNTTTNPSVLKDEGSPYVLENFTTSSFFRPYVTTIGLYNDGYELLAIAKLAQPIRMSDETDTTFIVRWDT